MSEPPPEYVDFVRRHLEPLRRDAARVVGDEHDADLLYPDVLTDVATHWSWLELQRTRLGRREAADDYLDRAFARQSLRWQPDQVDRFVSDVDISVWDDSELPPRPVYTSNATKLAPLLTPPRRVHAGAVCEAAIAWWHAYEVHRRRKLIAIAAVGLVLLGVLAHFSAPPI
jgi:hypothetical protein